MNMDHSFTQTLHSTNLEFVSTRLDTPYANITSLMSSQANLTDALVNNITETHSAHQSQCSADFKFWFATVGIGSLCLLGLLGNILSILVLQKDSHNRVACFLLQALAVADSMVLLLSLIVMSFIFGLLPFLLNKSVIFQQTHSMLSAYIVKYCNPIASMAQFCTVWITVLLAINRYVAICKPFIVHKWCTLTRARIQLATVAVVSVLFNIPRFFSVNVVALDKTNNATGKSLTMYTLDDTELGGDSIFSIIYNHVLQNILVIALPLIILISLNTKLVMEVRRIQQRAKQHHSHAQLHEHNITLVMIVIILILLICHTPDSVQRVVSIILPRERQLCGTPYYYSFLVCNLLIAFNSSTNFILYYFMRRGFRKILVRKLCGCVKSAYSTTSTMLNGLSIASKEVKLSPSKSCPEFLAPMVNPQTYRKCSQQENAKDVLLVPLNTIQNAV